MRRQKAGTQRAGCAHSAITDAIRQSCMEMLRRADLHLADLVLARFLVEFLFPAVLRLIDVAQLLMRLAQILTQKLHACAGCCIQLLCSEQGQAAQLVASTGHMSAERRRDDLHAAPNHTSTVLQMR